MKVSFTYDFFYILNEQVRFISKDKPIAAIEFKKDLKFPFNFKKSIHFEDKFIRDYVFKGYKIANKINVSSNKVEIFEFIKYMESL